MPKEWYDRHSVNRMEDEELKDFYRSIVADKKPYFMRYIYPSLMKQYNNYIKNTNRNALREFQLTVNELYEIPKDERTDRQNEFLRYYEYRMPVGVNNCVMNSICRKIENVFDGYIGKFTSQKKFNYHFMRNDSVYSIRQFNAIKSLYTDYNNRLRSYEVFADYERVDECESQNTLYTMNEDFKKECVKACPNEKALCNILLDICYTRNSTKRFAWSMCGKEIINNLLENNEGLISYPVMDKDGEISFCGERFKIETKEYKEEI